MSGLIRHAADQLTRFCSAVERRARLGWRLWTVGRRAPLAESALEWLRTAATGDGLAPTRGGAVACPGLTAAVIPTLWSLGETELAVRWGARLARLQHSDGSVPDAGLLHPSLFNTAQAAEAFALLDDAAALPEAARGRRKACDFLASRIAADGAIRIPAAGGSFERWAPAAVGLSGLKTVVDSAEPRHVDARRRAVLRAVDFVLRTTDAAHPAASLHVMMYGIAALLNLEPLDDRAGLAARRFLENMTARQSHDGAVAADLEHAWVSSAGLAHLAALWFRTGRKDAGDRALACLAARQQSDGSWTGSWGRGAAYFPRSSSAWTVKYALDAAVAQVAAAFHAPPGDLLDPPAGDDQRLRAVCDLAAQLPGGAELVDVGCGSGRYLTQLSARFPKLRLTGIDPSQQLLRHAAKSAEAVVGSVLRLPLNEARFDAAICLEALEHSLVPERAVAELCRIVRPGGRVLVIDKAARHQDLSLCEPWERWFTPESVSGWLARHCDDVTCTELPPGPQQRTPGLFLCWQATRRAAATIAAPQRRAA